MPRALIVAFLFFSTPCLAHILFSCPSNNDLYTQFPNFPRTDSPLQAVTQAQPGDSVFILSAGYPQAATPLGPTFWHTARDKHLHLYVEFPADLPGKTIGPIRPTSWERDILPANLHILQQFDCHFLPIQADHPLVVVGRVAGYDQALYGLPKETHPILFEMEDGNWLIVTTQLSNFLTARYEPIDEWTSLWQSILTRVAPDQDWKFKYRPTVHPAYGKADPLPKNAEHNAFTNYADWITRSRLLVSADRAQEVNHQLASGAELINTPATSTGDGTDGILEGYTSQIQSDGSQQQRLPLRADCNTESAMVLSLDHNPKNQKIAQNLLNYVFIHSDICAGDRANPDSPAFGLIGWGATAPAWLVANYGDDNARAILATILAQTSLRSTEWSPHILRAILANLRTTGTLGFRGDRIDMPALMKQGWKPFHDAATINYAPHFESYLWACYLWAYHQTGDKEFLDKTNTAIRMTMQAYPAKWRWGDNIERARMLLPLAWLVRVDDTPEHRAWLKLIATDLLACQQPCGAIQERITNPTGGHYRIPQSNEAYGSGETPLLQTNADPASDQLYTTGFALLGLHEAFGATGDADLKQAEDKLADYLCRIQVRSEKIPYLDGTWFRAFDYGKWDYWASSADLGWGVWSVEAGWGQAWTAALLALREKQTTLWDFTADPKIKEILPALKQQMQITSE